eukprot:TRINITY_DN12546_c0_g1_i1.p1 TRINITY_DN12546_c0_g1~~TRINITY_DN12546_c0_g1_i1.p1  ORF type:complete len:299 (+),score=44.70 TRINITY_DN12546_c0_g1_i1:52-897(+)
MGNNVAAVKTAAWTMESAVAGAQGQRPTNEDSHCRHLRLAGDEQAALFAVFDGHVGARAAKFAAKRFAPTLLANSSYPHNPRLALKEACQAVDAAFLRQMVAAVGTTTPSAIWQDGTTVAAVLVTASTLYCCNLGDSRAVLSQRRQAVAMSVDHHCNHPKERARIEGAGCQVTNNRINGILAVPRGIGDALHKDLATFGPAASTSKPTVTEFPLDTGVDFFIVACDGLWDVINNQLAVRFVSRRLGEGGKLNTVAKELVKLALDKGSTDNVSVILVRFSYN